MKINGNHTQFFKTKRENEVYLPVFHCWKLLASVIVLKDCSYNLIIAGERKRLTDAKRKHQNKTFFSYHMLLFHHTHINALVCVCSVHYIITIHGIQTWSVIGIGKDGMICKGIKNSSTHLSLQCDCIRIRAQKYPAILALQFKSKCG